MQPPVALPIGEPPSFSWAKPSVGLLNYNRKVNMTYEELREYYQIKLGDDGIKRVQELHVLRQHAEDQGDQEQLIVIDQELNQLYK